MLNELLTERFKRHVRDERDTKDAHRHDGSLAPVNRRIREYYKPEPAENNTSNWLSLPEFPSAEEFLTIPGSTPASVDPQVNKNRLEGEWSSKAEYLETLYLLLREDSIYGLRLAADELRRQPAKKEVDGGNIAIYAKVYVCGVIFSPQGIAGRMSFSLARVGKQIPWEQSKRLQPGGLVLLSPVKDSFKSKILVATVAARPLDKLLEDPPKVDLFFEGDSQVPLDPSVEYLMIEEKNGLYEASRHTLRALQRHLREQSNLDEHLVRGQAEVGTPSYVLKSPIMDVSPLLNHSSSDPNITMNVLQEWPTEPLKGFDASQFAALRRLLTKKLAIVQGPPGTGKTYVSVQAVLVMLANHAQGDPPIIVACQTNHAVDQLLRHIAEFEKDFARLGGRTKDQGIIKSRTIYELRETMPQQVGGSLFGPAARRLGILTKELTDTLGPLTYNQTPMDPKYLNKIGLLTDDQVDSLCKKAAEWTQNGENPFHIWLEDRLEAVLPERKENIKFFEFEEADLEMETVDESAAEDQPKDESGEDVLRGPFFQIADNFICRQNIGHQTEDSIATMLQKESDLWNVPVKNRPAVYTFLQTRMKNHVATAFTLKAKQYRKSVEERRIGGWERDEVILRQQKIIGMTTTGFSKYRGLIAALNPKIVMIEEAAETLEPSITVTCLPSVEHLILVGDHKQLRPNCHNKLLEDAPYWFNVSLFERMINNSVEFTTLTKQRRMIPEIRKLLKPIYGDIISDHSVVSNPQIRPDVPGMGGINSYFFTHDWPEERDKNMSALNSKEAAMVVGMFNYLVHNGIKPNEVTVLTFYNGQRKEIIRRLREIDDLKGNVYNVVTVDSYQGEENKVVLLSLVRSNQARQLGFVKVRNRICVALSRAQCGLYIFGNGRLLFLDKTWGAVLTILANETSGPEKTKKIGMTLPLVCSTHMRKTKVTNPADWKVIFGGCDLKCTHQLGCGHQCPIWCHPFPHDRIKCREACKKVLSCGHGVCKNKCGEECACKKGASCKGQPKKTKQNVVPILDLDAMKSSPPSLLMPVCKHANQLIQLEDCDCDRRVMDVEASKTGAGTGADLLEPTLLD